MEGAFVPLCFFGFLSMAIYLKHQRKMLEMRLSRGGATDDRLVAELQELKRQITELRDTTTRYDMSFDAALQRLEGRVAQLERRPAAVPGSPDAADAAFQNLAAGSRETV